MNDEPGGVRPWHLDPTPGFTPLIGRFVTMLSDTRRRLLRDLADFDVVQLDTTPAWAPNSIGTLLYHIAAIELDWTYADLLGTDFPPEAHQWFAHEVRDTAGALTPVVEPLAIHLARLGWVRERLLDVLGSLDDGSIDETRTSGGAENGVGFILHHLMQHEAEHRGQIGEIRAALQG